jgi:hypothetical protein
LHAAIVVIDDDVYFGKYLQIQDKNIIVMVVVAAAAAAPIVVTIISRVDCKVVVTDIK